MHLHSVDNCSEPTGNYLMQEAALLHAFKGYPQPVIDSLMWRYKRLPHLPQDGSNTAIPSVLQSSTVGANCSSFLLSSPPCTGSVPCCILLPFPPFSREHCLTNHLLQSQSQHCFYQTRLKTIYKQSYP